MNKISPEIASKEVTEWLDYKKINAKKRETYASNIETLTDAIVEGVLVFDKDGEVPKITHFLKHPLKSDEVISIDKVTYKSRVTVRDVQLQLKGVKSDDLNGMIIAYVSTLTGQVKNIIAAFDTEDFSIAQAIAVFFL